MDTTTIQLQEFLDGSLSHEAEAELLHRLSVSPERREILRSYMKQQAILSADRAAISVPYKAEQKLWAAIASMPPVFEPIAPAITAVSSSSAVGGFAAFKTAMIASAALVIGLVSGYFIWHSTEAVQVAERPSIQNIITPNSSPVPSTATTPVESSSEAKQPSRTSEPVRSDIQSFEAPLPQLDVTQAPMPIVTLVDASPNEATIPQAKYWVPASLQIREPGAQNNRPSIDGTPVEIPKPGFLERFDFSIHESFGKQFPNNDATNTSMPIITNSDISVKYMVNPQWWVGVNAGSSSVTQKVLEWKIKDQAATPIGYTAASDLMHVQTTWIGGLLEYRKPISSRMTFAANVGAAISTLGLPYYNSEVGLRFDVTGDVGVTTALRGTAIQSNVQKQYDDMKANRPPNSGRPEDVSLNDPYNFNIEISTGIYFHF